MAKKNEGVFSVGDVVELKSGGPAMVVDSLSRPSPMQIEVGAEDRVTVQCTWFAGKKESHGGFRPEILRHVKNTENDD